MRTLVGVTFLFVCYVTVTSSVMKSGKYVVMTNSLGIQDCSTDLPSQVLPILTGGDKQCGLRCLVSSCQYYQFKSTTAPIQCELYNQFPVNFQSIANCIGYRLSGDCSLPFTNNGVLYSGCVPGVTCWTVNRTSTGVCKSNTVAGAINNTVSISGQSEPVQSIFGWIIWMRKTEDDFNWNLTWASYKNGFGDFRDSNFWLGLENVHQLTSSLKYRLRIGFKLQSTARWYSVEYWSFKVGDETSTQYQLNVNGFSGDTANGFQYVNQPGCVKGNFGNGMKFTTSDNDNDLFGDYNCAAARGGGWWFNACSRSCLTCSESFFWWLNASASTCGSNALAEAHMMMKLQ